jgi:hypothetical protein
MQYLYPPLTNYTNYPIYNTHIYNNYELKNQASIASCINYPICNTYFKGHAKTNNCSSKQSPMDPQTKNAIPTLVLWQNHMSNMTHVIFTYKIILNWENM